MKYKAKIIADSVGPNGVRLTTMEFDIWKPLLAEFNTHGLLGSRNFPSSRAIPWERIRHKIMSDPHIPRFRVNEKGMQPGRPLWGRDQVRAEEKWLKARDQMLAVVEDMGEPMDLNIHKQWLNRLLEPWITVTGLVTAIDWDNFFNLRLELNGNGYPMAQDEFYFMARAMKKALEFGRPKRLKEGDCHIPYITDPNEVIKSIAQDAIEKEYQLEGYSFMPGDREFVMMTSAGKCATVSYDNLGEGVDHAKDYNRAVKTLMPNGHMSVFQHQAVCLPARDVMGLSTAEQRSGQLRGWDQFRKMLPNEACWSGGHQRELSLTLPELETE